MTSFGFAALLALVGTAAWAVGGVGQDKAKEEINENLGKIRANIQSISKNLSILEENIKTGEKNLALLDQEIAAKKKAHEEVNSNLDRAEKSLEETKKSEADFQSGMKKDVELVETTKNDIEVTKKRLAQLQENLKIIQENVEIDRENIEKVTKAKELWEKNTKAYKTAAGELDGLRKELETQLKSQRESLGKNNTERVKWSKQLDTQQKDLEQLEADLRKVNEVKTPTKKGS
jgi:chromosome segregation ATPase